MPTAASTKATPPGAFNLGIKPHGGTEKMRGGQKLLIRLALTHFCTVCIVGRSWGKTLAVAFLLVFEAFVHKGVYTAAYCAPTYKVAEPVYRMMKTVLRPLTKRASDVQLTIELLKFGRNNGVTIYFWSLEKYDNLRFFRLNRAVIDEGADIHEDAVFRVIVPMFANRQGRLLVIGTPKRRGIGSAWMHRLWSMGVDPDEPDYAAMRGPSHGNPFLWGPTCKDPTELPRLIHLIKKRGGDKAVREEIYAEWLDDEGAVFTNLAKVFTIEPIASPWSLPDKVWVGAEPDQGITEKDGYVARRPDAYVMGLDFGQSEDFTVATMFNRRTRCMDLLYRIHLRGAPYHSILPELHEIRTRYNDATVYYDDTGGHGGAIIEWMQAKYKDGAIGVTWSSYGKEHSISIAQRLFERAGQPEVVVGPSWRMLDVPWLRAEHEAYQIVVTDKQGNRLHRPKYGAPPGEHDDGVAACCFVAEPMNDPYVPQTGAKLRPKIDSIEYYEEMIDGVDDASTLSPLDLLDAP